MSKYDLHHYDYQREARFLFIVDILCCCGGLVTLHHIACDTMDRFWVVLGLNCVLSLIYKNIYVVYFCFINLNTVCLYVSHSLNKKKRKSLHNDKTF